MQTPRLASTGAVQALRLPPDLVILIRVRRATTCFAAVTWGFSGTGYRDTMQIR